MSQADDLLNKMCNELAPAMVDAHLEPCDPDEWKPWPPPYVPLPRMEGWTTQDQVEVVAEHQDALRAKRLEYQERLAAWRAARKAGAK
jgi:hypothetical protein